MSIPASRGSWI